MDYNKSLAEEIMSVQPMQVPSSKNFYMEYLDRSNPRIGQIFSDGDKHPEKDCAPLCCCCRQMWSKIWTPNGWIYEKKNANAYEKAVALYGPIYKAEIKKEREKWDKEHGITDADLHFPMSFVFDSKKPKI